MHASPDRAPWKWDTSQQPFLVQSSVDPSQWPVGALLGLPIPSTGQLAVYDGSRRQLLLACPRDRMADDNADDTLASVRPWEVTCRVGNSAFHMADGPPERAAWYAPARWCCADSRWLYTVDLYRLRRVELHSGHVETLQWNAEQTALVVAPPDDLPADVAGEFHLILSTLHANTLRLLCSNDLVLVDNETHCWRVDPVTLAVRPLLTHLQSPPHGIGLAGTPSFSWTATGTAAGTATGTATCSRPVQTGDRINWDNVVDRSIRDVIPDDERPVMWPWRLHELYRVDDQHYVATLWNARQHATQLVRLEVEPSPSGAVLLFALTDPMPGLLMDHLQVVHQLIVGRARRDCPYWTDAQTVAFWYDPVRRTCPYRPVALPSVRGRCYADATRGWALQLTSNAAEPLVAHRLPCPWTASIGPWAAEARKRMERAVYRPDVHYAQWLQRELADDGSPSDVDVRLCGTAVVPLLDDDDDTNNNSSSAIREEVTVRVPFEVRAHSSVLTTLPYFATLLRGSFAESQQWRARRGLFDVAVHGVAFPQTVYWLLQWMYTRSLDWERVASGVLCEPDHAEPVCSDDPSPTPKRPRPCHPEVDPSCPSAKRRCVDAGSSRALDDRLDDPARLGRVYDVLRLAGQWWCLDTDLHVLGWEYLWTHARLQWATVLCTWMEPMEAVYADDPVLRRVAQRVCSTEPDTPVVPEHLFLSA